MANTTATATTQPLPALPSIRRIGTDDLREALRKGADDFWAKPSHLVFLSIIYPVVALILSRLTFGYEVLPILFPLAAGFALLGPVAAIGLYELSRRREAGQSVSWQHAFDVVRSPAIRAIVALGCVLAAIFLLWLAVAWALFEAILGATPAGVGAFATTLFTTGPGWALILIGNGVGLLFAIAALTISVVSFPMMLDRHVDATTAVRTSLAAVRKNPRSMAAWGLIVAGGLVLGSIPLFVGLAIVMPILGHATWHLYRRTVGE